jgi:hypothetical protein
MPRIQDLDSTIKDMATVCSATRARWETMEGGERKACLGILTATLIKAYATIDAIREGEECHVRDR